MSFDDDAAPAAGLTPMSFNEKTGQSNSLKVGWTLRDDTGRIKAGYSFNINPQGLTRVESSRAQLYATKGSFYVDDFGPGPTQITLRQLVARGKTVTLTDGTEVEVYTQREDVQRFLKGIWQRSVRTNEPLRTFFHDNHLERGHDEEVYFPPNGLSIQRAVDLQNVWLIEVLMTGLEVNPLGDIHATATPTFEGPKRRHRYVVRSGDTLHRIAVRLAGKNSRDAKIVRAIVQRILKLNPRIKHKRHLYPGAPAYIGVSQITAKPLQLIPGEVLDLP